MNRSKNTIRWLAVSAGVLLGLFQTACAGEPAPKSLAYVLQADMTNVDVRLDGVDVDNRCDAQTEMIVYFCVIQALTNVSAYAPGSSVVVRVRAEMGHLSFSVADDGPGTLGAMSALAPTAS